MKVTIFYTNDFLIYEVRDLVIGDNHFGIKTNSVQWLDFQLKFYKEQIYKLLKENYYSRVVILGDLFDIRYAVNQQIGYEVKCLIREMVDTFNNVAFYIIAGNHDYYSPDVHYSQYNIYNLLFGYEFLELHRNLYIVHNDYLIEEGTIFAPWYWTENEEKFDELIKVINNYTEEEIKTIYCHSDLATWEGDGRLEKKPKGLAVVSGHIHNSWIDEKNKLYNIGSAFAINFNDVNNDKYIWDFDSDTHRIYNKFKNVTTPRFIQFSNEDIFTITSGDMEMCHVRLFINTDNINKAQYIERLAEIKKTFDYLSIKILTVNSNIIEEAEGKPLDTNITDFIENNIPDDLKEKYNYIKEIVNSKEEE